MDKHITTLFKTPAGSVWDTFDEAIVAHRIEISGVYIESYKMRDVVKAVSTFAPEELESHGVKTDETN